MTANTKRSRGRQLLTDANRLSLVNPKLAAEWHPTKNKPLTPDDVSYGSHQTVWWLCTEHRTAFRHEIAERMDGRSRCPNCVWKRRSDLDYLVELRILVRVELDQPF